MARTMATEQDNNAMHAAERMKDPELWIIFKIPRFVKATNIEIANAMLECSIEDGNYSLKPEDILGTQYFPESSQWIVYMNTKEAKVKALSEDSITIKEKTFKLEDYAVKASVKRTNKLIRLSIHDLPQSVSEEYIAEWVDSFAKRESDVMKHIVKPKENESNEKWKHLYSGHRFCYVSTIYEQIPRFSTIKIPDPRDNRKLIDTEVTLYYTGQTVNCSYCHGLDHQFNECDKRPKPKCNLCTMMGHTAEMGPTCFRCRERGHMSYSCPRGETRSITKNMPVPMPLAQDRSYRPNLNHFKVVKPPMESEQARNNQHVEEDTSTSTCETDSETESEISSEETVEYEQKSRSSDASAKTGSTNTESKNEKETKQTEERRNPPNEAAASSSGKNPGKKTLVQKTLTGETVVKEVPNNTEKGKKKKKKKRKQMSPETVTGNTQKRGRTADLVTESVGHDNDGSESETHDHDEVVT